MVTKVGGSGADDLEGTSGNDELYGNAGDDVLVGGAGADVLDGGQGEDEANYEGATASVTANLANASLNKGEAAGDTYFSVEDLIGSRYNDRLTGDSGDNYFRGGLGNDVIDGGAGEDMVDYRYNAVAGGVTVNLATGKVTGAAGSDTLKNIEEILGTDYNDTIIGNTADNYFRGGLGDDVMSGGGGFDHVDYSRASGAVFVNLATGKVTGADGNDTLSDFDMVSGSQFADTIVGGDAKEKLRGNGGNDTIDGGGGFDTIDYSHSSKAVSVNLATGRATGEGTDKLSNIEAVQGSGFADTLTGGAADNDFRPGLGNDKLDGGAGIDWVLYYDASGAVTVNLGTGKVTGADGSDTLKNIEGIYGSDYDDTIIGGKLADMLGGGFGKDTLTGAGGADTFAFYDAGESPAGSGKRDVITDFAVGVDKLDLQAVDASVKSGGDQAFRLVTAFHNRAGELLISHSGGTTEVLGDTDGNGVADFGVTLQGNIALTSSDILL